MQIVILIAFMITRAVGTVAQPPVGGWLLGLTVGGYLLGVALLSLVDVHLCGRALRRAEGLGGSALARHKIFSLLIQAWLLGGLGGVIALGYEAWITAGLGSLLLKNLPLVADLLLLGPFLVAVWLMWWVEYPFYREVRLRLGRAIGRIEGKAPPCWSRREYMGFNTRHQMLFVLVPVSLILLCVETLELYAPPRLPEGLAGEMVLLISIVCVVAVVFLLAPVIIVRIWKTRSLPAGPLRDEMESLCSRFGVRCRDIRVWLSGGVLANAGAMGLVGPVRYFLLSDGLLDNMSTEQLRAIFAHEIAHIRGRHILYAAMFAVASAMLCSAAAWGVNAFVLPGAWGEQTLSLTMLLAAWAVGFGFISKRFERQSDVVGAWSSGLGWPGRCEAGDKTITPDGAEIFASALQRVALLNGIPPRQRNWRHGRIADRIAYIRFLGQTGGSRGDIDRVVGRIKLTLWAAVLAGLGLTILRAGMDASTVG